MTRRWRVKDEHGEDLIQYWSRLKPHTDQVAAAQIIVELEQELEARTRENAKLRNVLQPVFEIPQVREAWDSIMGENAPAPVCSVEDAKDAARFRFRHSNYKDAQGYEYGYCKVRWVGGNVDSMLWASDEEIDAAIAAAGG